MPKIVKAKEASREKEAKALLERLAGSSKGVEVRHCLEEPLADLPKGTWLFGTLRVAKGAAVVEFTGTSNPPKR